MKTISLIISFSIQLVCLLTVNAQSVNVLTDTAAKQVEKPVTIIYDIKVKKDTKKTGIEETYNGGIKTIFISGEKARVRLVSLMRIQSIFFFQPDQHNNTVSIVKESGQKKYRTDLTDSMWALYNNKYDKDSCIFSNDSLQILNYNCKKATVLLKDGRTITAYYTTKLAPVNKKIEPIFGCIPGTVLQYEYDYGKGSITYTASKISHNPIAPDIFTIPSKAVTVQKFSVFSAMDQ